MDIELVAATLAAALLQAQTAITAAGVTSGRVQHPRMPEAPDAITLYHDVLKELQLASP